MGLGCCKGAYAGQMSGFCLSKLPSPPTTAPTGTGGADFWYPEYDKPWATAGCKNTLPLPFTPGGRPTFDTQLACCKGAYAGQTAACASSCSPALLPPRPLELAALTSGIRTTTRRGPLLAAPTSALLLSRPADAPRMTPSWHAARVPMLVRCPACASSCSPALLPPHPLEPAALTSGTRIIRQDTLRLGAPTSALLLSQQADAPPMTLSLRAARVPTRVRRPERASASFLPLPPQVQRKVADWMSTTKVQRRIMH